MPVQTFEPMTKDFATFDCDAHVTEPARIWERAPEHLTRDELAALKATIWWDAETQQLIVNGRAGAGIGSQHRGGIPGTMRVITNAGPGVKHDIQRALNVRNLNPDTALTQEQVAYLDHPGSYEPEPRLRDMDVQGIDQVMIIPTDIDTYPWLENAMGAKAFCKAYNEWAYEYTLADPERLYFAAMLPMQNPRYAADEVYRVAEKGCRVALVRPIDAMGNYPLQPKYEPVWQADGRHRRGVRHAPVPGRRQPQAVGLCRTAFQRRVDPQNGIDVRSAALAAVQRAELPGRGFPVGHPGADVRLFRASSHHQGGGVRSLLHVAELPARRMRQGLQALS